MTGFLDHLKYGLRVLLRNPIFAVVASLTIAVGVGSTVALFSAGKAVWLRRFPFPQADRLIVIWAKHSTNPVMPEVEATVSDFLYWRESNHAFEQMAAFAWPEWLKLGGAGGPERVRMARVTDDFFSTLGMQPALGRGFTAEDRQIVDSSVAVISDRLWRRTFAGDPQILGKIIKLDDQNFTVIGVLPPKFQMLWLDSQVDVVTPFKLTPETVAGQHKRTLIAIGRLRPGTSIKQAESDMNEVAAQMKLNDPKTYADWDVHLVPLREEGAAYLRKAIQIFGGAALLLLVVAFINLTNLSVIHHLKREKDFSIRFALGAGFSPIVKQVLAESLILAACGGSIGVGVALIGMQLLAFFSPDYFPQVREAKLDVWLLSFTFTISFVLAATANLLPLVRYSEIQLTTLLKSGAITASMDIMRRRTRRLFAGAEIALAFILAIIAGTLIRHLATLLADYPGFRTDKLITVKVSLSGERYKEGQGIVSFYEKLLGKLAVLPGVEATGADSNLPLGRNTVNTYFLIDGQPRPSPGHEPMADMHVIAGDYFRAMGMSLLRGKDLSISAETTPTPVIINETMSRSLFSGANPLGRSLTLLSSMQTNPGEAHIEPKNAVIIGVIKDTKRWSIDQPHNTIYLPLRENPVKSLFVVIQAPENLAGIFDSIRASVTSIDKDQLVYDAATMKQRLHLDGWVVAERFDAVLLGTFAAVALALALIGTYGTIAFSVTQRTQEIGIRMALGAGPQRVIWQVVKENLFSMGAGIGFGLLASWLLQHVIASLIFGATGLELSMCALLIMLFAFSILTVAYIPARRISSIPPVIAIRTS